MGEGIKVTVKHREGCVDVELQDRGRVSLNAIQVRHLINLLKSMTDGEVAE